MKKSNDWIFLNEQKPFLSFVFKPALFPWQQHTPQAKRENKLGRQIIKSLKVMVN